MTNDVGLRKIEICSIIATVANGILAWLRAHHHWWRWLAVSAGALGGLVHEIAQSGSKIVFFQSHEDGMYLG